MPLHKEWAPCRPSENQEKREFASGTLCELRELVQASHSAGNHRAGHVGGERGSNEWVSEIRSIGDGCTFLLRSQEWRVWVFT